MTMVLRMVEKAKVAEDADQDSFIRPTENWKSLSLVDLSPSGTPSVMIPQLLAAWTRPWAAARLAEPHRSCNQNLRKAYVADSGVLMSRLEVSTLDGSLSVFHSSR
jgi:hypothetical protein